MRGEDRTGQDRTERHEGCTWPEESLPGDMTRATGQPLPSKEKSQRKPLLPALCFQGQLVSMVSGSQQVAHCSDSPTQLIEARTGVKGQVGL